MAEYIEREAVMQKFADHVRRSNNSDFAPAPTWNQAVQIVEDIPAADVRPVVRGHKLTHNRPIAGYWASGKLDGGWDGMEGRVWVEPIMNNPVDYCSECGKRLDDTFQNFCPNCGADMREES